MDDSKSCFAKLSVCNLAVALGLVWGLSALVLAYLSMCFGIGTALVDVFSTLYYGYDDTLLGGLLGLLWGFVGGFISGAVLAMAYNWCRCCCPCKYCKSSRCCDSQCSTKEKKK